MNIDSTPCHIILLQIYTLYTREATFTKIFSHQQFLRTSANMVGVYVRENAGRWVEPLPNLVWNIRSEWEREPWEPEVPESREPLYFKPNPAEVPLISQNFLLYLPSLYTLGSMKSGGAKNFW